jgi:hypothetical protein
MSHWRRSAPRSAIPIDWRQGVAWLDPDRPPSDAPRHRWRQFVEDCNKFLRPSENWAERATGLGWDAMALFGCAPKRPLDYSGSADLLWAITGGRLVELHRGWAVIDLPVNRSNVLPAKRGRGENHFTLGETGVAQAAGHPMGHLWRCRYPALIRGRILDKREARRPGS